MFLTTIGIVCMHTLIKEVTTELHPFEAAFFRNLFGFPVVLAIILHQGVGILRTDQIKLHFIRGFGHVFAMMGFFFALAITPLAMANALAFTAPLFAAMLAVLVLGETFRWRRWTALIIGFAGTVVVLQPGVSAVGLGPLVALGASFIWGVILIVIKKLGQRDAAPTIVVYMFAFMTPISLIPALFVWQWPTWEQLGLLLAMGTIGTGAHLTLVQALRLADTDMVMPVDFFKLVWAAVLGYFLFAEVPDIYTWIGGTMIFAGATYLAIRENQEKRRAQAAAEEGSG